MEHKVKPLYIVVGVVIAVLMIGGAALLTSRGGAATSATSSPTSSAPAAAPSPDDATGGAPEEAPSGEEQDQGDQDQSQEELLLSIPKRNPDDPAAIGDVDAPVVITEWFDYRCPFCSAFNEETLPQLQSYVDEGKVRIEFRDFAVFGPDSEYAAIAARAAGKQGKQIEFMDALFVKLPNKGHPPVDEAVVTEVAQSVGVADMAKFKEDLGSEDLRNAVLAESYEAQQFGLSSVPSFLVHTHFISGAQPAEVFKQTIDAELAKVES
uniref:DsbA family protein n=1 Tax=Tessaracoccus timonensis TaxID=2161816 RepID=UPI000D5540CC|nr:thioredoxin domain-containing protein [Tessaracoccus timonensis]